MVERFVKIFNRELGKQVRTISPETLRLLESRDWPGNVRELQATMKYAMVHATGDILTLDCLPAPSVPRPARFPTFALPESRAYPDIEPDNEAVPKLPPASVSVSESEPEPESEGRTLPGSSAGCSKAVRTTSTRR